MTDKKVEEKKVASKKCTYIIQNVTNLPDYKREDLKVGMVVTLDEKLGDAYCKRHILKKGIAASKLPLDHKVDSLKAENADLKAQVKALSEELAGLKTEKK